MKHDTDVGRIMFKSLPEYYHSEELGAKANTLRVVTQNEYDTIVACLPETISIKHAVTGEAFIREISSIVQIHQSLGVSVEYGNVLILISWWS